MKLERDDGRLIYEGDIRYDGMEYEFEINAENGKIISWESESEWGRLILSINRTSPSGIFRKGRFCYVSLILLFFENFLFKYRCTVRAACCPKGNLAEAERTLFLWWERPALLFYVRETSVFCLGLPFRRQNSTKARIRKILQIRIRNWKRIWRYP